MPKKRYAVGVDLGGTKILSALVDGGGRIVARCKTRSGVEEGGAAFLKRLKENIHEVLKNNGHALEGIGIGCPGLIDSKKGMVWMSPNIPFLKDFELASELKKTFGTGVILENDANAGLYGEYVCGAAKGYENIIGIFIGTGIGGAMIFNGELYRGSRGAAGEIGHMRINDSGPFCGCGKRGCLEASAGRLAMAGQAAVLAARQKAPQLYKEVGTDVLSIKSGILKKSIEAGDEDVKSLVEASAREVGVVMASLAHVLDPDLIVLGGGVVEAMGKLVVEAAESSMREHGMSQIVKHVKVVPARLKDDAIVLGAAHLVKRKS